MPSTFEWDVVSSGQQTHVRLDSVKDVPSEPFQTQGSRRVVVECQLPNDVEVADASILIECLMAGYVIQRVAPRRYYIDDRALRRAARI